MNSDKCKRIYNRVKYTKDKCNNINYNTYLLKTPIIYTPKNKNIKTPKSEYHDWCDNGGLEINRDDIIKSLSADKKKIHSFMEEKSTIIEEKTPLYQIDTDIDIYVVSYGDKDEGDISKKIYQSIRRSKLVMIYNEALKLASELKTSIEEKIDGCFSQMSDPDIKNFLFHIVCKNKNFYTSVLIDPDFCLYLLPNNYHHIHDIMFDQTLSN